MADADCPSRRKTNDDIQTLEKSQPSNQFQLRKNGGMYGSARVPDDSERTAFRKEEKKYKLYYDQNAKSKKKKMARTVDLSEVVDFRSILESFNRNDELPHGVFALQSHFGRPVFCMDNRPGFYFIPEALSIEEQCHWIKESLTTFPQPPNRTNHNAIYGPIYDLFISANERKLLMEEENSTGGDSKSNPSGGDTIAPRWKFSDELGAETKKNTPKMISASVLLRKLRWSTLGLQFDWSKRSYNVSLPHNKIPDELCQLARKMAGPAMTLGEDFRPEAAIVNYFGLGDTLGGHLDDMEADWSKPIVSMSLGCKGIFLLGGKCRDDSPKAMFLRSGDIILMAGEARECFHGVPRIFTDKENADITALELQFSEEDDLYFLEYSQDPEANICNLGASHYMAWTYALCNSARALKFSGQTFLEIGAKVDPRRKRYDYAEDK